MTEAEEAVEELVQALILCDNTALRRELREKLVEQGAVAVPRLLEVLLWEHPVVYDVQEVLLHAPSARILERTLERLEQVMTVMPIADPREQQRLLSFRKREWDFFHQILERVLQCPSDEYVAGLIRVLRLPLWIRPELKVQVGQALLRLAQESPRPEFREALPLLDSVARLRLWLILRKMPRRGALPIPAREPDCPLTNLPVPVGTEVCDEGAVY